MSDKPKGYDLSDHFQENPGESLEDMLANNSFAPSEEPPDFPDPPGISDNVTPISPNIDTEKTPISRCSELGNAHRLLEKHGGKLRYIKARKSWIVWTGKRWELNNLKAAAYYNDVSQDIFDEAELEVEQAYIKVDAAGDDAVQKPIAKAILLRAQKYHRHAEKSQNNGTRNGTLTTLSGFDEILRDDLSMFDIQDDLFNVQNGTVNLETGELQPHERTDTITKISPTSYDKEAQCPTWIRFLDEMSGSNEITEYLQVYAGYCLTGSTEERKMLFLYGGGNNGKSTFFNTIIGLMGCDYAITTADNLLIQSKNESHPTELSDLDGPRLAVNAEITKGAILDEGRIKRITGGSDSLKARRMREDFYEFIPHCKLIIAANNKPTIRDMTDSIWNRLSPVQFGKTITAENVDKKLPGKLKDEHEGILAWMVEGAVKWHEIGLIEPECVEDYKEQYRTDQDFIMLYMQDRIIADDKAKLSFNAMFEDYKQWAESENEYFLPSKKKFNEEVDTRCIPGTKIKMSRYKSMGERGWRGVRKRGLGDGLDDKEEDFPERLF